MEKQQINYVVLRWFEELPEVAEGEDLDLLVTDEDATKLDHLLTRSPRRGTVPCDVYNVHGTPTFARKGLPYYPPHLANQILSRSIVHENGARIPCPEDHFLSLAFHALYHKGYSSGLPLSEDEGPITPAKDHDYSAVLHRLADEIGVRARITMRDLDGYLNEAGWRPSIDVLGKWSVGNSWCAELHDRALGDHKAPRGLVVFIIREKGAAPSVITDIRGFIREQGFSEVFAAKLDAVAAGRAAKELRGGNWGRGPFPTSGGPPHTIIVCLNPTPQTPSEEEVAKHPGLTDARIPELKKMIRDWWNGNRPLNERCNIIHSSDSEVHAVHYVQTLLPDSATHIMGRAYSILESMPPR